MSVGIGRNQINTEITTVFKHIKLNIFLCMQRVEGSINTLKEDFPCRHELP